MQVIDINESIDVGAVFGKNRIKPKWFVWNGKKYQIKEITYTWKENQGEAKLIHFSVTDGATLFELCLNQKTLMWRLEKASVE
ncbi:MAG: hypothetical protein JW871_03130 [Endomicrobiales bacterium]|nr:hypothetical protein [Endomicrobiales bacterium]